MPTHSLLSRLRANYKAWLTVALVNIPLSLALAVASLWDYPQAPLMGIITAIWAGFTASVFASSKHNIYGPAGALSGILLAFSLSHGASFVPFVAIGAGGIIFVAYAFRLSKYVTLIPSSALHGFLLGVGITIAASQLNNALWISAWPQKDFLDGIIRTVVHMPETNLTALVIFVVSFLFLLVWKRKIAGIPGALPLTFLGILTGYASVNGWIPPVDTIHDKFATLSFSLVSFPDFGSLFSRSTLYDNILLYKSIAQTSLVVAIVAILETLISAKIAENLSKSRYDKDLEVRGLALANICSGLVGGMPATAVLVRTALNVKSGADHRISASVAALGTLIISAVGFGMFKFLPMSVIAAILMSIAVGMIEVERYRRIWHYDRFAFAVTMLTAAITTFDDPLVAILAATTITLIVFIKKVSDGNVHVSVFRDGKYYVKARLREYISKQAPEDTLIYKFSGSLTYINAEAQLDQVELLKKPKNVIFSFSSLYNIDLDGLETLEKMVQHMEKCKISVYYSGVSVVTEKLLKKTKFFHEARHERRVFATSFDAIQSLGLWKYQD